MKKTSLTWIILLIALLGSAIKTSGQENQLELLKKNNEALNHRLDQLTKQVDDLMWQQRLSDIALVDKQFICGPAVWKEKNPDSMGAGNPVKFWTYIFIPKSIRPDQKYPLIVLPHGGVHADFTTYYIHIIREFISQGYVIVAPEYRGSTGYGKAFYEKIDYGGLEVEDVYASSRHMIENYDFVDSSRVGIVGWSHGGLISLMNIFEHPESFRCAFAGVPVSDLIARMGYYDQEYRDLYEADYHIGQSANENIAEYRRRSPAWNVHKMKNTPLLIHTNTNDDDVNVLEVEHLIKSLKAEDKKFEYEIFQNIPGGHSFDRIDTKKSREIRLKIHLFLGRYLKPEKPFKNLNDLNKAAYGY